MKFSRFRHIFCPGPPTPLGEGPEGTIEPNHARFANHRHLRQRLDELRPFLPPAVVAVLEQVDDATSQQIIRFLSAERPDLADLLEEELKGSRRRGPDDLRSAAGRMGLRKASDGLNGRHSMSRMAAEGTLLVALPVPRHLEESVSDQADGMVFLAENHVPPHLEDTDIPFLDDLLPQQVRDAFAGVKGILAEGQIRGGGASTRRSVVRVMQLLPNTQFTLFLHHMPHRPPHAEFAQVDPAVEIVEVP